MSLHYLCATIRILNASRRGQQPTPVVPKSQQRIKNPKNSFVFRKTEVSSKEKAHPAHKVQLRVLARSSRLGWTG